MAGLILLVVCVLLFIWAHWYEDNQEEWNRPQLTEAQRMAANRQEYLVIEQEAMKVWEEAFGPVRVIDARESNYRFPATTSSRDVYEAWLRKEIQIIKKRTEGGPVTMQDYVLLKRLGSRKWPAA